MRTLNPNPTSGTSGTATSERPQLPAIAQSPLLQAALSGLDVSLDEELDRYRHWQANGQRTSYLNAFRPLTPVVTTSGGAARGAKMQPPSALQLPVTKSVSVKSETISEDVSSASHSPLLESSNYLENLNLDDQDRESQRQPSALLAALSNIPSTGSQHRIENHPENLNEDDLLRDMADSYGEDEEITEAELNRNPENTSILNTLLTPLGIASLLLLLLSSAVIGYLLVDPSGLSNLIKPKQASPTKNSSYLPDAASDVDLQAKQNPLGKENLLADPKNTKIPFVSLPGNGSRPGQSLDSFTTKPDTQIKSNLVLPKVSVSSVRNSNPALPSPVRELPATNLSYESLPTFAAPPVVENAPRVRTRSESFPSPIQANTAPKALAPSSSPSYNPIPPVTRPNTVKFTPTAASTQPIQPIINNSLPPTAPPVQYAAPISTSTSIPTSSNGYKVIVDNSYVSQAQQVDKEAFVRPSDGNLQLGAYRDANTAQQRAETLRRQGIPARVDR